MWQSARVAVVVPAYREARLIARMLRRVPEFVDDVIVVDDASDDGTAEAAQAVGDARVRVVRHAHNQGVGAAIVTGYELALSSGSDVLCVMAGDDQMDPEDLKALVLPVALGEADYVKGNRFVHPRARDMPKLRRFAGEFLSFATRTATGLDISDSQCGYTALSANVARRLPLRELWPRFGYPNDLLGLLAAAGARVRDVPVRPVYADEQSGIGARHVILILGLVTRRFWLEGRRRRASPSDGSLRSAI
jgi:glycosyltransferase involved in cell wall biosynthesis